MKTPYAELLPPLTTAEFEALEADIKTNGMREPIIVDEDGNILDGHHRYKIQKNGPTKTIKGLSEPEKMAFVIRCNLARRNLSPDQKKEVGKRQREIAKSLREQDAKRWTQKAVAQVLGVGQQTVSDWFGNNTGTGNVSAPVPDARVKVPAQAKPELAKQVEEKGAEQAAADWGITARRARQIASDEQKQESAKAERAEAAKKISVDCGVHHGDFRKLAHVVPDGSVDLIFTDPPYDEEAIPLYGDLAEFAAKKLKPGGWCLAYAGHSFLPELFSEFSKSGLVYAWTFAQLNSGGDLRFRKWKLQSKWKPILGYLRPPEPKPWWDWFPDTVSGGKEKESHEWQQAESEASHFIAALCPPKGIVCDPFCGSGTTLAAALKSGRRAVGFEIEKTHVETARVRIHDHAA